MAKAKYSIYFSLFLTVIFTLAVIDAMTFAKLARFFPLYIAIIAVFFSLLDLIFNIRNYINLKKVKQKEDEEEVDGVGKYILWIVGYIVGIYLLGFIIATLIFLIIFLFFETKFGVIKTALGVGITLAIILSFGNIMNLYWPKGLLGIF